MLQKLKKIKKIVRIILNSFALSIVCSYGSFVAFTLFTIDYPGVLFIEEFGYELKSLIPNLAKILLVVLIIHCLINLLIFYISKRLQGADSEIVANTESPPGNKLTLEGEKNN